MVKGGPTECFSCGDSHPRSTCRFKDATCRHCGRSGHIAKICQSAQPQFGARFPHDREKQQCSQPPNERIRNQRGSSAINLVVPSTTVNKQKIRLTIHIEGKPCLMEIDTSSATSIVSWATIKHIVPKLAKRQLDPCSLLLKDYQGAQIPIVGCGTFQVKFKKFSGRLSLVIVADPLPSLLGLNCFDALGLTIQGIHAVRPSELESLCEEFPTVFDDSLGKYTGTPVSFALDPQVQP